ncbi:MAG: hypothetical protein PHY45_16220 [Rhodocyclaceae bacterium]|nr:hypothetical protein [Rhodocyclaceae bacterium]
MAPIDIPALEQRARDMRAEELRRLEGVFLERMRVYARLLGASLLLLLEFVSEALRPLFSWTGRRPSAR